MTFGMLDAAFQNAFNDLKNSLYIAANSGRVYESTRLLSKSLSDIVRSKCYRQFGADDCAGVLFPFDSSASQKIAGNFDYKVALLNALYSKSNNASVQFSKRNGKDLLYSLGKADILNIEKKQNGISALVLDTYDFNKNENNVLVKIGSFGQDIGVLAPYFSLHSVFVSNCEIKNTLKNLKNVLTGNKYNVQLFHNSTFDQFLNSNFELRNSLQKMKSTRELSLDKIEKLQKRF